MKKAPKIIYFINGSVPTDAEVEAAESIGANVVFRNTEFIDDTDTAEDCDGVAGSPVYEMKKVKDKETGQVSYEKTDKEIGDTIPESYKHFPAAEDVMAAYKANKKLPEAKEVKAPAPGKPATWNAGK